MPEANLRDGKPIRFEELSRYTSADLVALFEHEHWETKVRGRSDLSPFDPLTTPHVDRPLRPTD